MGNDLVLAQSVPDANQGFDFDPMVFDTTPSSASSSGGLNLSPSLVQGFTRAVSMRDLIDPEHIAPGFLERADEKVAEAEQMNGWRHQTEG
ncbi:hypothetical protein TruAng_010499 [Truncatella angustata]|nr:hypothetical protein TruAng_010499 [Truncatella angustata]